MSTLYELFKVKENASEEEITEAYHKILEKAKSFPKTENLTKQIQRINIAYGILSNPEKRQKYDMDLAQKKANELLQNIQSHQTELPKDDENNQNNKIETSIDEERLKKVIKEQLNNAAQLYEQNIPSNSNQMQNDNKNLKEERKAKRLAKKEAQYQKEKQMEAYGRFLENQGYKVKYPWTWLRIKRLLITVLVLIITAVILWHVPFINQTLKNLYEENFAVKFIVDIVISIFSSIINGIKSIFIK